MGITYFTAPTQCFQVFYVCTFQRCCARFTLRRRNSGTRWRPERPPGCHQSSQTQVIGRNMGDLEICVVDRCKYSKMNHRYHPGNMFLCFLGLLVCMYIYIITIISPIPNCQCLHICPIYVFWSTNVLFLACSFPVGEGGASHTAHYAGCGNCGLKNGGNHPVSSWW